MALCYFVSDLHGHIQRYRILFQLINRERPSAVFLGGDLLPIKNVPIDSGTQPIRNFISEFLIPELISLRVALVGELPRIFLILGNDDPKSAEIDLRVGESEGLWEYMQDRKVGFDVFNVYGYGYVPPTPFQLKDWERYDISRYVEPGCTAPEEGWHSLPPDHNQVMYATIQDDLQQLLVDDDLSSAILLFHAPPYQTNLDRAALDGKIIDHVPVDIHVGSIAIRRVIEFRQPLLTLHGHIHESSRLTGEWIEKIGRTYSFSAAYDGSELALVRFDPSHLEAATREIYGEQPEIP